jgi:uncharacterized LabA/DUF88 family protein
MKKIAIFVDVQNIYYTVKQQYSCNFDYNAFWRKVTKDRQVVKAYAYATSKGDEKQSQFQNILRGIGFELKLTPYLQRADGSKKADWDVGITLDMLDTAKDVDVIILASGDGDFTRVVEKIIKENNIEVEVYGVPELTATPLKNTATAYFPVESELLLQK